MRGRRPGRREADGRGAPAAERRRPRRCVVVLRPLQLLLLGLASLLGLLLGWASHAPALRREPWVREPRRARAGAPEAQRGAAVGTRRDRRAELPQLPPYGCGEELGLEVGSASVCLPRRMLFIGGLQRSGTSALASLLQALPNMSGLTFEADRLDDMEAAPWKHVLDVHTGRWMKWAYFKRVVATGGAEGKLLQSVFPYRYLLWDAKFTPTEAVLTHPSALSPLINVAARRLLWKQWSRFWRGQHTATFVDKSPENLLMAPFLQRMFGGMRASFVFVSRHPLSWALAAAKWSCLWEDKPTSVDTETGASTDGTKAPPLACLEHLLELWLSVHEKLEEQRLQLIDSLVLMAESDEWLASPAWLPRLGISSLEPATLMKWRETQRSFRRASHQYVYCFLNGRILRRSQLTSNTSGCGGAQVASSSKRILWLDRVVRRLGQRTSRLGYNLNISSLARQCCTSSSEEWTARDRSHGDLVEYRQDSRHRYELGAAGEGERSRYERHADAAEGEGLHAGKVALVVATNFLSGFNGMQQRAAQLVMALSKLGYAVHYVSVGPLNSTAECAAATPSVICHASGSHLQQYEGFANFARSQHRAPTLVLLGFTSLALEVVRALREKPLSAFSHWKLQSYDPSHIPKAHHGLEVLQAATKDFPFVRVAIFTDDIHFERSRRIIEQDGPLKASHRRVLAAVKALELRTYSRAGVVFTVSDSDRNSILAALREAAESSSNSLLPIVRVVPFAALAADRTPPREAREVGAMLYVGTCHPIAKVSIVWLLRHVFPKLEAYSMSEGLANKIRLRLVGNGWQGLRKTPPFDTWIAKKWLRLVGKLDDATLRAEYARASLFISPLLNATGIATKNFHAMSRGLPVLTTRMGIEGLELPNRTASLCCEQSRSSSQCHHALRKPLPMGLSAHVSRPTLQEECALQPKLMECQAWQAAMRKASVGRALLWDHPTLPLRNAASHQQARRESATGRRLLSIAERSEGVHPGWHMLGASAEGTSSPAEYALPVELKHAMHAASSDIGIAVVGSLDRVATEEQKDVLYHSESKGSLIHPAAHPSGALLVADDPTAFARGALDVLRDPQLWSALSLGGVRHQRMLSVARQSAAIGNALEDGLQLEAAAEQACVLVMEAADRQALRAPLSALLRLRIAVHVLLLPEASTLSEVELLGWEGTQGVFFYQGSAREQWTAIVAAKPFPALRFALVVHSGLADLGRQLLHPDCHSEPVGPDCILEEGQAEEVEGHQGELPRFVDALREVAFSSELREVMGAPSGWPIDMEHASEAGVALNGSSGLVENEDRVSHLNMVDSASLLHLLRCMRKDEGELPLLLVLPAGLLPLRLSRLLRAYVKSAGMKGSERRSTNRILVRAAKLAMAREQMAEAMAAQLLRIAMQYERELISSCTLVLAASKHEASLLTTLGLASFDVVDYDADSEAMADGGGFVKPLDEENGMVRTVNGELDAAADVGDLTRLLSEAPKIRMAAPQFSLHPPPLPRVSGPTGRARLLVVADFVAEAQEGLLWLVREVWPRVRAEVGRHEGREEVVMPILALHGAGWRSFFRLGRDDLDQGQGGSWLGAPSRALYEELLALRRTEELAIEHRHGEDIASLDRLPYADSTQAIDALDGARVLLVPRLHNETGPTAPSWGEPVPEVGAHSRGLPVVSTRAGASTLRASEESQEAQGSTCGMLLHDDPEAFANAAVSLLVDDVWLRLSRDARACATAQHTPARSDLAWTNVLIELLSS